MSAPTGIWTPISDAACRRHRRRTGLTSRRPFPARFSRPAFTLALPSRRTLSFALFSRLFPPFRDGWPHEASGRQDSSFKKNRKIRRSPLDALQKQLTFFCEGGCRPPSPERFCGACAAGAEQFALRRVHDADVQQKSAGAARRFFLSGRSNPTHDEEDIYIWARL